MSSPVKVRVEFGRNSPGFMARSLLGWGGATPPRRLLMYRGMGVARNLVSVGLCALWILLSVACGRRDIAGEVREGDRLFAEKNYKGALLRYQNAGQIDARNGQVRQKLALTYFALNQRDRALKEI